MFAQVGPAHMGLPAPVDLGRKPVACDGRKGRVDAARYLVDGIGKLVAGLGDDAGENFLHPVQLFIGDGQAVQPGDADTLEQLIAPGADGQVVDQRDIWQHGSHRLFPAGPCGQGIKGGRPDPKITVHSYQHPIDRGFWFGGFFCLRP
ncbi:hypothetical protein [Paracoccus marcusii]|uniref:hypothetical protein n=1 Tax=Paracoccus marcusii TaxID=59779 RepID=UPI0024904506|nr:hypothetical protein [Paracoccus marcusii]